MNDTFIDIAMTKKNSSALPFFYFFYVKKGMVDLLINKNKKITLNENEGLFINKGVEMDINTINLNSTDASEVLVIKIDQEMISKFNYSRFISSGFNISVVKHKREEQDEYCHFNFHNASPADITILNAICEVLKNTTDTSNDKKTNETTVCNVQRYEYELLLSILGNTNPQIIDMFSDNTTETIAEKAAKLVMSDYSKTWNINTLSSALHMSPSAFKKSMYKEVGSVSEFVNNLKIVESMRRLRRTNDSLTIIAHDLGYCSNSYFTQVFFKQTGILPSDVREHN